MISSINFEKLWSHLTILAVIFALFFNNSILNAQEACEDNANPRFNPQFTGITSHNGSINFTMVVHSMTNGEVTELAQFDGKISNGIALLKFKSSNSNFPEQIFRDMVHVEGGLNIGPLQELVEASSCDLELVSFTFMSPNFQSLYFRIIESGAANHPHGNYELYNYTSAVLTPLVVADPAVPVIEVTATDSCTFAVQCDNSGNTCGHDPFFNPEVLYMNDELNNPTEVAIYIGEYGGVSSLVARFAIEISCGFIYARSVLEVGACYSPSFVNAFFVPDPGNDPLLPKPYGLNMRAFLEHLNNCGVQNSYLIFGKASEGQALFRNPHNELYRQQYDLNGLVVGITEMKSTGVCSGDLEGDLDGIELPLCSCGGEPNPSPTSTPPVVPSASPVATPTPSPSVPDDRVCDLSVSNKAALALFDNSVKLYADKIAAALKSAARIEKSKGNTKLAKDLRIKADLAHEAGITAWVRTWNGLNFGFCENREQETCSAVSYLSAMQEVKGIFAQLKINRKLALKLLKASGDIAKFERAKTYIKNHFKRTNSALKAVEQAQTLIRSNC